ncbi:ATP-binding protein [Candidatus Pacearchaeota archaeon]|nr:ATP-binding protein [Candidatus Pacearchaeota archaeon]
MHAQLDDRKKLASIGRKDSDTIKISNSKKKIEHLSREIGDNLPEQVSRLVMRDVNSGILELVANAYDADAKRVEVQYSSQPSKLIISDDGRGMDTKDLKAFYRVGDSNKIGSDGQPMKSAGGRTYLGSFGVATLVLKSLAQRYTLKTVKDGLETLVHEEFSKQLSSQDKIPYKTHRVTEENGTILTLEDLKFEEGKGSFTLQGLRTKIQSSFRKLTRLPDFSIYVNGEKMEPAVMNKAVQFDISGSGKNMGDIKGTAYLTQTKTELAGVHVSVNGRTITSNESVLGDSSASLGLKKRVIFDVDANDMSKAVLFDRGAFRQDDPAYLELVNHLKRVYREIRRYDENNSSRGIVERVANDKERMAEEIRQRLKGKGIEEMRKDSVEIEFARAEPRDGIPGYYDPKKGKLVLYEGSGPLELESVVSKSSYEHALFQAFVEAIAMHRSQQKADKDTLDSFLEERADIIRQLNSGRTVNLEDKAIHPRILYNLSDLSQLSGIGLGAMRYIAKGHGFAKNDEKVTGEQFLQVKNATNGMVNLHDFTSETFDNLPQALTRLTEIFNVVGNWAHPFVRNYSSDQKESCYFVEGTAIPSLKKIVKADSFNRHLEKYDPAGMLKSFGSRYLHINKIVSESKNLSMSEARKVIDYANKKLSGIDQQNSKYSYREFVQALQYMRGNIK